MIQLTLSNFFNNADARQKPPPPENSSRPTFGRLIFFLLTMTSILVFVGFQRAGKFIPDFAFICCTEVFVAYCLIKEAGLFSFNRSDSDVIGVFTLSC